MDWHTKRKTLLICIIVFGIIGFIIGFIAGSVGTSGWYFETAITYALCGFIAGISLPSVPTYISWVHEKLKNLPSAAAFEFKNSGVIGIIGEIITDNLLILMIIHLIVAYFAYCCLSPAIPIISIVRLIKIPIELRKH